MDGPFDSALILIFFVVFLYLYLVVINQGTRKNHFPFNWKDDEADVERHFGGYKQK